MRKYILSSVMSVFLVAGLSMMLTATGTKTEKDSCCSGKTAEVVQTMQTETAASEDSSCTGAEKTKTASASCADKTANTSCCSSKNTKAEAENSDVQMIQTSSAPKSSCAGSAATTTAASADCSSSATPIKTAAGPQPGECTKVPSGIKSQQANKGN
ncbi:MAG: hypothetical protein ACOCX0_00200 [Bacteroidota bacterium]